MIVFDASGRPHWVVVFTEADLAWFRKPLGK